MKFKFAVIVFCLLHLQNIAGNCSSFYQGGSDSILVTTAERSSQASLPVKARIASWAQKSKYILPALLVGYGFTSLDKGITRQTDLNIRHELLEEYPHFSTKLDNKLQYAPVAAVYTLNLMGVKSKNPILDRTAIYLISNSIMGISVNYLKGKTHKLRPSGANSRSFPSGHTATAFVGAEFMRQEFSESSPWYGYVGYTMATATGALRMMNDQHWLSDVLAGAGVGILSTKLTYLAYPWIKKKLIKNNKANFIAVPVVQGNIAGFSLIAPL